MDYQIVLSPSARRDLRELIHYISLDASDRALAFGQFLLSKTKLLGQHPEIGRIVPEFGEPNIREIVVRSYRVIYRIDSTKDKIEVIRFWHAARGEPEIGN